MVEPLAQCKTHVTKDNFSHVHNFHVFFPESLSSDNTKTCDWSVSVMVQG